MSILEALFANFIAAGKQERLLALDVVTTLLEVVDELLKKEGPDERLRELQRVIFVDHKLAEILVAMNAEATIQELKVAGRAFASMPFTVFSLLEVPMYGARHALTIDNYLRALSAILMKSDAQIFALYAAQVFLREVLPAPPPGLGECLSRCQLIHDVLQQPTKSKNPDAVKLSMNVIVLLINHCPLLFSSPD